ncbi:MAG: carbohydrate ABC transporter permease [Firmicutes bacterium]|nr:carbohydrate ABC transporter permease [Bacillota bacterium]
MTSTTLKPGPRLPIRPRKPMVVRRIGRFVLYVVLIGGAILTLLPFVWMLLEALKPATEIYSTNWLPSKPVWSNFWQALTILPFGRFFLNSAIITLSNVILQTASSTMVAYGFSRFRFRGRNFLFMLLIATLMVPYYVTLIPVYVEFDKIGWVGTFLPLIVPAAFGNAFFIFLMRQFFSSIPKDMDESAKVDGASAWSILTRVLIPQSKPAMVTIAIFAFLGTWNDFLSPLIYLSNMNQYTVAVGLQYFVGQYTSEWNLMMAVSLLALLPCILLFFFAQKYFIQGIVVSSAEK